MIENTNTKQFYPGPILNNTLEITDFLFNDAEQIKIKHSKLNEEGILVDVDLNYPTDYEVTKVLPSDINAAEAALTASTGQIMLKNVNVLAGEKLTVYRVSQIIQDKDYPRTGAFPAATHEGALDYLTMQNQEQKDELDRALKVPVSTEEFSGNLPVPIPSRALKINNDGTGFEMSEFDPDTALALTEDFKNQAQQAAIDALSSQTAAANSETIATQQAQNATTQAANAEASANNAAELNQQLTNNFNTYSSSLQGDFNTYTGSLISTKEDGMASLANASNALRQTQITNCILEIPQRIKLELADGVLTLKAGSTVIVPNGAGVFDEVETSEDLTVTYTGSASGEGLLFYDTSANNIQLRWLSNQVGSGTSVPTSSYWLYYSTDENKVYNINNGVSTQASFPVGVFEVASSGSGITSINQIFNGIGYIGSTIWVDKGVKVLVPNGRNEDGSLNNIEYTTELVKVRTETATNLKNGYILLSESNGLEGQAQTTGEQTRYYDEQRNLYFNGSKYISRAIIGTQSTDSNVKITHLKPKMAFHSVDFNDSGIVAGWGMPSNRYIDLSLGATGSTYKAPANGWFTFNRRWGTGTYSGLRCLDPNGVELYGFQTDDRSTSNSGGEIVFTLPVKKGNYGKVTYNTTGVTEYFRFIYAEGEI